ncbi:hypothetical protein EO98_08880 [Methanosarcina sp. 2.H.T.1A.6]|uniref:DUF4139 domain-containing protein n=1 Tax=unclassified Methanosarcina TaxID=2644672 RepID=UPI000621E10E|nr:MULTISPECIES: DUF4139 domain-containing protein [unclassified Methanosarcina]KKG14043.1 hypothetical protein EO94_13935 [Methanosarcina sp. 2.H.T.1A.3]KKG21411.1 hypothetical protein EO98_08880 [Methanosarcina sp. 2.H.T.1A.6]KKG25134.1 hypothetical protein EO97_09170 [Methanosarcina sp. 2.H.T.1A.15]KKG25275.1 hypothetical protein EO96_10510 [Methanosarcina sp. 2.H.T.1A.8]
MGVKKHILWLFLVFIAFVLLFSAYMPHYPEGVAQANVSGSDKNQTGSDPGISEEIPAADPPEILASGAVEAGDMELTIYEQGLALVKERRDMELERGTNRVEYTDIASGIIPSSVLVEDPEGGEVTVLEQNYEYDLASSSGLLEKYLGREITVTGTNGDVYTGRLLSHEGGSVVLETETGEAIVLQDVSRIELQNASELSTKPTIIWQIYSPVSGTRKLLTSYLTEGLSWKANYVLKSNADDTEADIRGWANIDNRAGITYENAALKLVSGELNRASPPVRPLPERTEGAVAEEESVAPFVEESISEYHLYTLDRPATLKNNQEKQISLFSIDSVPVEKELIYDSSLSKRVRIFLTFENSKETGPGMPLPAGVVRVYNTDSADELQFLGEDSIGHTPLGEELKLTVGSAFDLTVTRNQTDYQRISDNVERVSYEIQINNSKSEPQNVTVVEHLYGEWEILETSDEYRKTDAFTIEFKVTVPANGTKTITYTAENRF